MDGYCYDCSLARCDTTDSVCPNKPKRDGGCQLHGDPGWLDAHHDLRALHIEKSATYGVNGEKFKNFTILAQATGLPPEFFVISRVMEKAQRSLNQILAGNPSEVEEYPDMASLSLIAESFRSRL